MLRTLRSSRGRSGLRFIVAALLLVSAVASAEPAPQTLRVAAAADLMPVLPALAAVYEQQTGVHLLPSFASSATLTEQIRSGAPFDVFLSADTLHPLQVVQGGLADSSAPVPYARGVLVLWARKDSPLQPLTLDALRSPKLERLAIANPAHAPYGLAAQQFLQHEHLIAAVAAKFATAENISQAAQFAESGNAQAGLLSLTTASSPHFREAGTFVVVPAGSYAPLVQAAVVLRHAANLSTARAFVKWLTSPAVQSQLKNYGLEPAH